MTKDHTFTPAQSVGVTDQELRKLWRDAGGEFYGPRVETGSMPEAKLLPFLRALASQPSPAATVETKSAPELGPSQNNAERLPQGDQAGSGAGTQCSAGNASAPSVEEIAKLVDPVAHEMYDAAYAAKDWPDQMTWIKRLEASREKASNILFRLNPPPAAPVKTTSTPEYDDKCEYYPYFEMLWKWFEERRGKEDMRANAIDGLSVDDFKQMLDEHETNLIPDEPQTVLGWLATKTNYELSYSGWDNEDPTWDVHSVNGGRNDREWTLLATGSTPEEALRKAMSLSLTRPPLLRDEGDKA